MRSTRTASRIGVDTTFAFVTAQTQRPCSSTRKHGVSISNEVGEVSQDYYHLSGEDEPKRTLLLISNRGKWGETTSYITTSECRAL
jgi:dUTPase